MLNAGVMALPEGTTVDGFEQQLGINVLGHWALLSHLLPTVVATPGARVVTLSSFAQHQGSPLDVDNPHMRGSYEAWKQYGNTKLAARHLAAGAAGAARGCGRRRQGARRPSRADQLRPADHDTGPPGGGGCVGAFSERWAA